MSDIYIMRVPISLPCVLPVDPDTGHAAVDGEPLPMEQRTETCCRDAFWTFELAPVCDMHLRELLATVDDDYQGFVDQWEIENGPLTLSERETSPWPSHRYAQDEGTYLGGAKAVHG